MRFNYSDWRSIFPQPPFEGKKCHLFFKESKTGPYTLNTQPCYPKSKEYRRMVDMAHDDWQKHKSAVVSSNTVNAAVTQAKLEAAKADKEKQAQLMKARREKGMEALKRKRTL